MPNYIKNVILQLLLTVVSTSALAASSCYTMYFTHYTNPKYVVGIDNRELVNSFLSVDLKTGGRGQKWSLFKAYGSILPGGRPMFYVALSDNSRKVWGIEFLGSFWFQAELSSLDYSPWAIVEARAVDGLPGVITLHSPASEEKVQQPVCLVPTTIMFRPAPGTNVLRFHGCSVHPKEWSYWVPKDADTGENCANQILKQTNYHSPVVVDPQSLCSSVFLKPISANGVFASAKESTITVNSYAILDTENMFNFTEVWIPRVDFIPSSQSLFVNLIWGENKDLALSMVKESGIITSKVVVGRFSGDVSQVWLVVDSKSHPGSFGLLDAETRFHALTIDDSAKPGTKLRLEGFYDKPTQLWKAVSTQTGTDCTTTFVNSFSGMSVGNIISNKTTRAAVPSIDKTRKHVVINWQPSVGGRDVYYVIPRKDLISAATDFTKELRYAMDPSKCFIPLFDSSGEVNLSLIDCFKSASTPAAVWRFGDLVDVEKDRSQFCVNDAGHGKVWCLADVKGSFAPPIDKSGEENKDTIMRFDSRLIGVPTVFTTGNGYCLAIKQYTKEEVVGSNFVTMSCHSLMGDYSIENMRLIPDDSGTTNNPQKKYFISVTRSDGSLMCYGKRGDTLSFNTCDKKDPGLKWVFLSHEHIQNVKDGMCLSGAGGGSFNTPISEAPCSTEGPQMVFFASSYTSAIKPNVYMQLHHWDLSRWTDDGLCVTALGSYKNNSQDYCGDPDTDRGRRQLWWREFLRTKFAQGDLVPYFDNTFALSMSAGYVLAHQTVYKWEEWSVQQFYMYDTYQTASGDSVGITYCYSDNNPGHPSTDSIVADTCKQDGAFGINSQTWLFTPVILVH
ncbi:MULTISPECIES: RICIN domain-containing protein [Candidatus Ichthyocystis]|uniref:RICIN domain-containing protein n=1 Tax=Candidatus Ichthyocystis TaxID=2929841 RepID=UPI000B898C2F|nr:MULTISPECIES: RICIN domain-containing protein [Ichthyocystis]